MMLFKRRKEPKPQCVHAWQLADYHTGTHDCSTSVDIEDIFTLRCANCGDVRKVDGYEFDKLKNFGLVKEAY